MLQHYYSQVFQQQLSLWINIEDKPDMVNHRQQEKYAPVTRPSFLLFTDIIPIILICYRGLDNAV